MTGRLARQQGWGRDSTPDNNEENTHDDHHHPDPDRGPRVRLPL
jgi:hypothetical protein